MTDSFQERLQSIKTEGATRSTKIREIIQTAAKQSMTELKEGMNEIRSTPSDSTTAHSSETTDPSPSTVLSGIRAQVINRVRVQLVNLDAKLATEYGDRYSTAKQRFAQFQVWYNQSKAKAEAVGTDPVQQKQAEIELKVANQGAIVARKEQQIRQQVKQLVNAAIAKW